MRNKLTMPEKECFLTGNRGSLHKRHVFGGAARKYSEKYRCYIYLTPELHNLSDKGIHFNRELNLKVKKEFEKRLIAAGWTKKEFVETFGKNYI